MLVKFSIGAAILLLPNITFAQKTDTLSTISLLEVTVSQIKTVHGTGHMPEIKEGILYAGKKNEVILVDSLDANKALNNTRQILGRIPGLNIVETESSGFTANGIATRGLDPNQSIEMNVRQNGYNISADIFGYNEAYYIPPMEAVSSIEMVRGAASLQFGSQFGGMVNYTLKEAPKNKPFEFFTAQTMGSFGLFNSYNSAGGNLGKFSYFGFLQHRNLQGWRPNSVQTQVSGFGKVQYKPNDQWTIGAEYSLLRNRIQMPGGQTDSMFNADPQSSSRARNWLKSPWNIVTGFATFTPGINTKLYLKSSYLFSSRDLVWFDHPDGPRALDIPDPQTGMYDAREVELERMKGATTEIRLLQHYRTGSMENTLAAGIRVGYSAFERLEDAPGTTGLDFDLHTTAPFEEELNYKTLNIAPFAENIFRLTEKLSVTPGFRFEYIFNTVEGEEDDAELEAESSRNIPLLGLGVEFKASPNTNFYGNISQAYRPIDYAQLTPLGVSSRIDPNLKDAKGYNADLGYRGTVKNYLNFDLGLFYMAYNGRIGLVLKTDPETGEAYTLRTNVANSVHKGIETYVEFNPVKLLVPGAASSFSVFNSFAFTDAQYTSGEFKGKRVEKAPRYVNRTGINMVHKHLSITLQMNNTGDAFGDASNAYASEEPVAGIIPAYTVFDCSGSYSIRNFTFKFGVNNLSNKNYFTLRTDEYPGPGIIPASGRSFYGGLSAVF